MDRLRPIAGGVQRAPTRRGAALLALALALGTSACARGPTGTGAARGPQQDSLRVMLTALRDSTGAPALSVAIARDGRVVLADAVGFADVDRGVAATPNTVYRIGSVSKLLTVAAAARLAERGLLDWNADVRRYVPEFPVTAGRITPRLLAAHLAGIRHYGRGEFVNAVRHDSVASSIRAFARDTLLFVPGSRYAYSSFGYVLLSLAIERAARAPFLDVVQREVLAPLALRATGPDRPDSAIATRAVPYDGGGRTPLVRAAPDDLSNRWGAGGFLASVVDLARFGSSFVRPGYLADSTIRMLTTPPSLASGARSPAGLGWRVGTDSAGRRIWHHAGSSLGGRAMLVVWPDEGVVVAIAGNLLFGQGERTAFRFSGLVRRR